MSEQLYDVWRIGMDDPSDTLIMGEGKTLKNAEAIEAMAIMRQEVEGHFFKTVKHGEGPRGAAQ